MDSVFPLWMGFRYEFLYKKSLVPFAALFVTPCPFLNDQKWCKCRCSEWQEHHHLGQVPPALPNLMQGRLCWASCCSQQGLALSPPWQEHPTGWFWTVQWGTLEKQETRHRSGGWRVLLCVCCKDAAGLSLWVGFWGAVGRISLRETHRILCPVVAVSHWLCKGISATALYFFLIGGFSHFLFFKMFLEKWFWHLCSPLGYNLWCRSVLQQALPPGCLLIMDVVFSCTVWVVGDADTRECPWKCCCCSRCWAQKCTLGLCLVQGWGIAGRVNFGGGMEMRLNMPAGRASRSQAGCGAAASAGCPAWLSAQGTGPPGLTQPKRFFQ